MVAGGQLGGVSARGSWVTSDAPLITQPLSLLISVAGRLQRWLECG